MLCGLPLELASKPLLMAKFVPFDMLLSKSEWGKRWSEIFAASKSAVEMCNAVDKFCDFSNAGEAVTISDRIAALAKISKPRQQQEGGGEEAKEGVAKKDDAKEEDSAKGGDVKEQKGN